MQVSKTTIERILVRGTNWVGDAVMTTPALSRLRSSFPGARITLLATPRTAELFEASELVDEVLLYRRHEEGWPAFLKMARTLLRRQFDLAILLQNAFEAALLAWLGGARLRIGYATHGRSLLLTHALKRCAPPRHQTHDYLELVAASEEICLGASGEPRESKTLIPSLRASPEQTSAAEALLQRYQIAGKQRLLVALNAGATNSRAKCWPADHFAALADTLIRELGAQVILLGARAERAIAEQVIAQMQERGALNLAGETSLGELIGLLDHCALLISNDTGPAHIAAALGTPTLTIFGPTNEFETAPRGLRAEIIRAEGIECARCMLRDCPIDHRCMRHISSDEVAQRACALLAQPKVSSSKSEEAKSGH
jgi:heptosyltransferase-2